MRFIDTNVLVYAATTQDACKRKIAVELITHALEVNHNGVISVQVMSEFSRTMLAKKFVTVKELDKWVSLFYPLLETEVTMDIVRQAALIQEECGIPFYDAQIVATAEKLGCTEIVSEDLNDGQLYRGMAAVNPFKRKRPAEGASGR